MHETRSDQRSEDPDQKYGQEEDQVHEGPARWPFHGRMSPYRWMMLSGAGAGAALGFRRLMNRKKWRSRF